MSSCFMYLDWKKIFEDSNKNNQRMKGDYVFKDKHPNPPGFSFHPSLLDDEVI